MKNLRCNINCFRRGTKKTWPHGIKKRYQTGLTHKHTQIYIMCVCVHRERERLKASMEPFSEQDDGIVLLSTGPP